MLKLTLYKPRSNLWLLCRLSLTKVTKEYTHIFPKRL